MWGGIGMAAHLYVSYANLYVTIFTQLCVCYGVFQVIYRQLLLDFSHSSPAIMELITKGIELLRENERKIHRKQSNVEEDTL